MNKYESIIIIGQNVEEEGIKSLIKKFTDLINTEGKVSNVNEMGLRKLAELERNYRITDEVIKFIVVKKDEE